MTRPTAKRLNTLRAHIALAVGIRPLLKEECEELQTELDFRQLEIERLSILCGKIEAERDQLRAYAEKLRGALEFSEMTLNHALALKYLGEGSTNGMAKDAITKAREALAWPKPGEGE